MIRTFPALIAAMMIASPALAQNANAVSLSSDVMVERTVTGADGRASVTLEEPRVVVPGDHLVFVLRYRNNGAQPAGAFVVTNPLPAAVAFQGTADTSATVSVDGGHSWGALNTLEISNPDGTKRPARSEDVTHIRWAFAEAIPAGQAGRLMFRGIVR
ncbi:MAG: hypothetical protein ABL874_07135 [Sphingopyxis sp.]